MARYRLKPGMTIGALAAESDQQFLEEAFVDAGTLAHLLDANDPHFLLVGRAGAGKTALIEKVKNSEHASAIDPEELSMQYLHNSTILQTIKGWGVSLEIFYKYLWRHVCILELIRLRYGSSEDVPGTVKSIFDLATLFRRGKETRQSRETREASQAYLRKYADEYWIKADTRIKQITTEMETKLRSDAEISASLDSHVVSAKGRLGGGNDSRQSIHVEREIVERAQSIVSDFLIADLHKVVDLLGKHGFEDRQNHHYLVIDDLDKNWMPDDALYLELLKSLLYTVQELNRRLQGVKIVVALREDIFQRIFHKATPHEPQREKWNDCLIRVRWTAAQLEELVNRRLAVAFRGQYTNAPPTYSDVLPPAKKNAGTAFDYVLERTFMRPRDVIDFINTIFMRADSVSQTTWRDILRAEGEYSKRRLDSVLDEWRNCYLALPVTFAFLRQRHRSFKFDEIERKSLEIALSNEAVESCVWARRLRDAYLAETIDEQQLRFELAKVLVQVGILEVKLPETGRFENVFETSSFLRRETMDIAEFRIHGMFHYALGVVPGREDVADPA